MHFVKDGRHFLNLVDDEQRAVLVAEALGLGNRKGAKAPEEPGVDVLLAQPSLPVLDKSQAKVIVEAKQIIVGNLLASLLEAIQLTEKSQIVKEALETASDICVYTNRNFVIEEL